MSVLGVMITYACCWWLVLFMVLPWRVQVPEKPSLGHAASAPVQPGLRRKLWLTTLFATIPTAALYVLIGTAQAEVYHAGGSGDCEPLAAHTPDAGILTTDGVGAQGKAVRPATIDAGGATAMPGNVTMGIEIPAAGYLSPGHHPALDNSKIYAGNVQVSPDGAVTYNGQPVAQEPVRGKGCR